MYSCNSVNIASACLSQTRQMTVNMHYRFAYTCIMVSNVNDYLNSLKKSVRIKCSLTQLTLALAHSLSQAHEQRLTMNYIMIAMFHNNIIISNVYTSAQ